MYGSLLAFLKPSLKVELWKVSCIPPNLKIHDLYL